MALISLSTFLSFIPNYVEDIIPIIVSHANLISFQPFHLLQILESCASHSTLYNECLIQSRY